MLDVYGMRDNIRVELVF